jgi:hypothetical protein
VPSQLCESGNTRYATEPQMFRVVDAKTKKSMLGVPRKVKSSPQFGLAALKCWAWGSIFEPGMFIG